MEHSFYEVLQRNAATSASRAALITANRSITYDELLVEVDQLANGLHANGLSPGDRVALLAQNRIESIVLFGACSRQGVIIFPLNWRLTSGEIEQQLVLADVSAVFVDAAGMEKISEHLRAAIPLRVALDDPGEEGWLDYHELNVETPAAVHPAQGETPFLLLATAAVEGVSRAALLSNANVVTACEQVKHKLGLAEDDCHLAALPLFHITGLELSLAALQAGGVNVLMDRFDPAEAIKLIDRHGVTLLASFPPMLSMLLDAAADGGANWGTMRYVLGLDTPDVIQRFLGESKAAFWTGYGQSETSGVVTLVDVRQRPGSVGQALAVVEMQIFSENGTPLEPGSVGEIVVRSPLIFLGYWRDEDATRFAGRHGWHHTGDLGSLDEEGYLFYNGRKPEKDLIKSGGENIYPAEVEHAISGLPQVRGVCVIGVPDEKWGESVKAIIELEPDVEFSPQEIIGAIGEKLASYKKPRRVEFVDQLPRDAEGQIDRIAVKAQFGTP